MDYKTILELIFISSTGYGLYQWLKYLIEDMGRESKVNDLIEWTDTDEHYHKLFLAHVINCRECDPHDNPCSIGDKILTDWRNDRDAR